MRRPLPAVFTAFALGVWCAFRTASGVVLPVVAALAALSLFVALFGLSRTRLGPAWARSPWLRRGALFTAVFAVGWGMAAASDAGRLTALQGMRADALKGRVTLTGEADESPRRAGWGKSPPWMFTLRTKRFELADGSVHALSVPVRVRCYGFRSAPPIEAGDAVTAAGRITWDERGPFNPLSLRLESGVRNVSVAGQASRNGFAGYVQRLRESIAVCVTRGIESEKSATGVLRALLLGYRDVVDAETRDMFVRTGTLHVFAISGLHVGIVALLLTAALSVAGVSRVYWGFGVTPLLCLYTLMTGARPSAVRACIMASVFFVGPLLGRRVDGRSALAGAGLAILAWSPAELMGAGFILSFSVVAGLIVLYPFVERTMRALVSRVGGWLGRPVRLVGNTGGRSVARRFSIHDLACVAGARLRSLIALSICAWVVTLPLNAYFFGRFVPIALLGNLIVIPLTFLIVLTGGLSIVGGCFLTTVSQVFNHANLALVSMLLWTARCFGDIPGGSVVVTRPPAWAVWSWFGALGLVVLATRARHGDGDAGGE